MDQVGRVRGRFKLNWIFRPTWRAASMLLMVASLVLLVSVLLFDVQRPAITLAILIALLGSIAIFVLTFSGISRQLRRKQRETTHALETKAEELRQMADNIQEIFWALDPQTKKALFVNPAYETITGRSCQSLMDILPPMKR